MLEDTWHMEFPRRPEMPDGMYPSMNVGYPMWDNYPVFAAKPKKEEKVGLAEAITSSILSTGMFLLVLPSLFFYLIPSYVFGQISDTLIPLGGLLTGRIDLQRKLFCSIQLVSLSTKIDYESLYLLTLYRNEEMTYFMS